MSLLDDLASKSSRLVVGVMSGTSMDSIDVAVCRITGAGLGAKVNVERFGSSPYTPDLLARLRDQLNVQDVAELNVLVAEEFAAAINLVLAGLSPDIVASHGQTIYHHSRRRGALKTTLQIGDGDIIAERLGVLVVSDFRMRDIAAGGEGAPLTSYADAVLFGNAADLAVLNLGGIANLTLLGKEIVGFDTGPANAPLDHIARQEFGEDYDRDGVHAKAGHFDAELVEALIRKDEFFALLPPKSTGIESYGEAFVQMLRTISNSRGDNLQRLATEFVIESIARQVPAHTKRIIIAGGGTKNAFLMLRLRDRLTRCTITLSDDSGVPGQAREAMSFAILANGAVCGLPTSIPTVTGAIGPRTLGKLSFP